MIFDEKKREVEDSGPGSSAELISQDSFLDRNLQAKQIENIKITDVKADENVHAEGIDVKKIENE